MASTVTAIARTPLHDWHAAHGARFTDRDGWQVVAAYAAVDREVEAARSGLAIVDLSAFAKINSCGPGVATLVHSLAPDSAATNVRGVAAGVSAGFLACRLTNDHLLLLQTVDAKLADFNSRIGNLQSSHLQSTDVTFNNAGFVLLGPGVDAIVPRITHLDMRPSAFPENSCAETSLAGVEALLVRSAEFILSSLRVYVACEMAEYVWERILQAGRHGSVTPLGLDALSELGALARPTGRQAK